MSVLFLPPSAGAASVPDATETVSGKIRIATSAEATAGTLDTAAMTPLKVKSVVDAAVVGGVTYQGTFDTSAPVDLSNAEKGDLYIISVAGSYQGITWAVGDHLLVNADMGGTISPSKIDKVDNTDAVTSVAGRTGAVTLSASDVSGLAAVATSGAYSDLSGTPTLGTAAAEDVGTAASNVVQLDGSARLPAVDGSQLTNLPPATVAALNDIGDVTTTGVSDGEALVYNQSINKWISGSAANTVINQYNATGTAAAVNTQDLHIYRLYGSSAFSLAVSAVQAGGLVLINNLNLSDCTITGPTFRVNGEGTSGGVTSITVKSSERRLFYLESITTWLEITATSLDRLADVSLSSPSAGEALIYNGTLSAFENSTVSVAAADVSGLATVATTGAYSDLSGLPLKRFLLSGSATVPTPTQAEILVGRHDPTPGAQDLTLPTSANAFLGTQISIFNESSITATIITAGGSDTIKRGSGSASATFTLGPRESVTISYVLGGTGVELLVTSFDTGLDVGTAADNLVKLDGSARLPAVDGSQLTNLPSGAITLDGLTDVNAASPNNGDVIAYNSTSGNWESAVQSLAKPPVNVASPSADVTLSAPSTNEEVYIYLPSVDITVNLVSAVTCGAGFRYYIKNRSSNVLTVDPSSTQTIDGASTFDLTVQNSSISLISDGSNWFIF